MTLEEVVSETGIPVRNIKYWSSIYELEFRRQGRRNFYPRRTVEILMTIDALSAPQLFTTHFIRWLVDLALGRPLKNSELIERYRRLQEEYGSVLGLPEPVAPRPGSGRRVRRIARTVISVPLPPSYSSPALPVFTPRPRRKDDEALL